MDQAMGDLQTQLEEMRRMWEDERDSRQRVEHELEAVRRHKSPNTADDDDEDDERAGKRKRAD